MFVEISQSYRFINNQRDSVCFLYDFPQFFKVVIEVTTKILTFNTQNQGSTLRPPRLSAHLLLTPFHALTNWFILAITSGMT